MTALPLAPPKGFEEEPTPDDGGMADDSGMGCAGRVVLAPPNGLTAARPAGEANGFLAGARPALPLNGFFGGTRALAPPKGLLFGTWLPPTLNGLLAGARPALPLNGFAGDVRPLASLFAKGFAG